MPLMPAHFAAGAATKPFHAWIQPVFAVIGPDLRGEEVKAQSQTANFGLIAVLSLTVAMALLLIVEGHGAGRRGNEDMALLLFWSGVVLLVVPISFRISWPRVARGERFFLLFLLVEALFYYKAVHSPTSFVGHDEFLHWIAADDLMNAHICAFGQQGSGSAAEIPPSLACSVLAPHITPIVQSAGFYADVPDLAQQVDDACEAGAWSVSLRQCFVAAQTIDALHGCLQPET